MNAFEEEPPTRIARRVGVWLEALEVVERLEGLARTLERHLDRELRAMVGAASADLANALDALAAAMAGARLDAVEIEPARTHRATVHLESVVRYARTTYARVRVESEVIALLERAQAQRDAGCDLVG